MLRRKRARRLYAKVRDAASVLEAERFIEDEIRLAEYARLRAIRTELLQHKSQSRLVDGLITRIADRITAELQK